MVFATTKQAAIVTGLSKETLREWTTRRALIEADVSGQGRGKPAQYSWQTLLLLRIAVALKTDFGLELESLRELFAALRRDLERQSFIRLWGNALLVFPRNEWELRQSEQLGELGKDAVVIFLNPHLESISSALPKIAAGGDGQLELFPVQMLGIRKLPTGRASEKIAAAAAAEKIEAPAVRRAAR